MKCPVDNETLMMSDRNGVEIDYCPKCRGVWLDRGELDKIIEKSMGDASANYRTAPVTLAEPGQPSSSTNTHADPYAERPREPRYEDRRDVRDERREARYENRRRHDDDYDDDGYYRGKRKKRESFLSELFDF